jgi:hypothetical protein
VVGFWTDMRRRKRLEYDGSMLKIAAAAYRRNMVPFQELRVADAKTRIHGVSRSNATLIVPSNDVIYLKYIWISGTPSLRHIIIMAPHHTAMISYDSTQSIAAAV